MKVLTHVGLGLPEVIFAEPCDLGFTCISRRRAFQILLDRGSGRFIRDPQAVYQRLCRGLGDSHLTLPELCKLSSEVDLQHELALSGKSLDSYPQNLLCNSEQENLKRYQELLGLESLELQACCLNQNPQHIAKFTKVGLLPTFTKCDKMMWVPGRERHLLAKEKYAGHGFPVTQQLSALLKIPVS